jgi:hypothetical protein
MALSKPYAGQAHWDHYAFYSDGRIGVSYDQNVPVVPLNLADLSEASQAAWVTVAAEIAEKQGIGTLAECETEFVAIITKAIEDKEAEEAKEVPVEPK